MDKSVKREGDRILFGAFLGLLLFAPWPYGARIPFGWSILVTWVCLLGVGWLFQYARNRIGISESFYRARPVHVALLLWLGWLIFQVVPIPLGLLDMLSANAARIPREAALILGDPEPTFATISLNPWASQSAVLMTVGFIGTYFLCLLLVNSKRRLKLLAWTLVYSGLLQAVYGSLLALSGIEQLLTFDQASSQTVAKGSYTNRNHFAGYMVICLSVGIGLMLGMLDSERHVSWRGWIRGWVQVFISQKFRLRLYLVVMVIALVLTHSRMGNASFFAAMLIAGVLALLFSRKAKRSMVVLITSLIVIDIIVVGAWFGIDKVADRLEETLVTKEVSSIQEGRKVTRDELVVDIKERGRLNRDLLNYQKDYWLTGSGLGSFEYVYPVYRGSDVGAHHDHAHNDYLEFLVEAGVPGFMMLGFVILYSLKMIFSALRNRRDTLMRGMAFASLMSITALLIHSAVDFNLQVAANAMTFMVILAIAVLARHLPARGSK